jgi:hypothetical protein
LCDAQFRQPGGKGNPNIVTDRVEALIGRLAPGAICDECIVERLALNAPHLASHRTRELAGMRGFERREDGCAICGEVKSVTRRNRL